MVKTPSGTRISLGYEKAIYTVNVKLQHILKTD